MPPFLPTANAQFVVNRDLKHTAQIKRMRSAEYGGGASVIPAPEHSQDCDVLPMEFVCGHLPKETPSGRVIERQSTIPQVFSYANGLGDDIPRALAASHPDIVEQLIMSQLRYYGNAHTGVKDATAARSSMGFVVFATGTQSVYNLAIPGIASLGMKLRLGLPMDPNDQETQPGAPSTKRVFVAKQKVGPQLFAQRVFEHLQLAVDRNPEYVSQMQNPQLRKAPWNAMTRALLDSCICAAAAYQAAIAKEHPYDADRISRSYMDTLRVLGYGGYTPTNPALANHFRKYLTFDPTSEDADHQYNVALGGDDTLKSTQANAIRRALAGIRSAQDFEDNLNIGMVVRPARKGARMEICMGV